MKKKSTLQESKQVAGKKNFLKNHRKLLLFLGLVAVFFVRHYKQADVVYNRSGQMVIYRGTEIANLDGAILGK